MIQPLFGTITHLELDNIRAFDHLELDITADGQPRGHSLIIGRNGTCKSTLLRCMALALCNEQHASALLLQPEGRLVGQGASKASIRARLVDPNHNEVAIDLDLESSSERDRVKKRRVRGPKSERTALEKQFFAAGYGAVRGPRGRGTDFPHEYHTSDAVGSLFDYAQGVMDSELVLRRLADSLNAESYERAMLGIKHILGLDADHTLEVVEGGGVRVSDPDTNGYIPLESWSDGYRMTFAWLIDLYGRALQAGALTEAGGIRGILLVDAIEQHLHPAMQMALLLNLRDALPEMQLFATTYSPLLALSTESTNLIALHRQAEHVLSLPIPSMAGYSADDVLEDKALFGIDPYAQATRLRLERYRELSATTPWERTEEEAAELHTLAMNFSPEALPQVREDPISAKLDEIAQLLKKERPSD